MRVAVTVSVGGLLLLAAVLCLRQPQAEAQKVNTQTPSPSTWGGKPGTRSQGSPGTLPPLKLTVIVPDQKSLPKGLEKYPTKEFLDNPPAAGFRISVDEAHGPVA